MILVGCEQPMINRRRHDPVALGPRMQMVATVDRGERLAGLSGSRVAASKSMTASKRPESRIHALTSWRRLETRVEIERAVAR